MSLAAARDLSWDGSHSLQQKHQSLTSPQILLKSPIRTSSLRSCAPMQSLTRTAEGSPSLAWLYKSSKLRRSKNSLKRLAACSVLFSKMMTILKLMKLNNRSHIRKTRMSFRKRISRKSQTAAILKSLLTWLTLIAMRKSLKSLRSQRLTRPPPRTLLQRLHRFLRMSLRKNQVRKIKTSKKKDLIRIF